MPYIDVNLQRAVSGEFIDIVKVHTNFTCRHIEEEVLKRFGPSFAVKLLFGDALLGADETLSDVGICHGSTVDVVCSRNILASASDDASIKVWCATSGICLKTIIGHEDAVTSIAFSHDGLLLLSSSRDCTARIWHATLGRCERILRGHTAGVESAAFSPDDNVLATGGEDGIAVVWGRSNGNSICSLSHAAIVHSLVFSPTGSTIITGSDDGYLRQWCASSGECLQQWCEHALGVRSVAVSMDGALVVSSSSDGTVRVWPSIFWSQPEELKGEEEEEEAEEVDDDVIGTDMPRPLGVLSSLRFDAAIGSQVTRVSRLLGGHAGCVFSTAFSPSGKSVLTVGWDGMAKIWDAECGVNYMSLSEERLKGPLYSAAFSINGAYIATGHSDGHIIIWCSEVGEQLLAMNGHDAAVRCVAFCNQ